MITLIHKVYLHTEISKCVACRLDGLYTTLGMAIKMKYVSISMMRIITVKNIWHVGFKFVCMI